MKRFFRALAVVGMTAGAVSISACAPTAKNTQASLAQEQANARKLVAQMEAKDALIKDRALNTYVRGIMGRVAAQRPKGSVP